jgi:hypothetical protein
MRIVKCLLAVTCIVGTVVGDETPEDTIAISLVPPREPVTFRHTGSITTTSVVNMPNGQSFRMEDSCDYEQRLRLGAVPDARDQSDDRNDAKLLVVFERTSGKVRGTLLREVEFDSLSDDEPNVPAPASVLVRTMLRYAKDRSLTCVVAPTGQIRSIEGLHELYGEELIDDLGALIDVFTKEVKDVELQSLMPILPPGSQAIGKPWTCRRTLPSLGSGSPAITVEVTAVIEGYDAATRIATIGFAGDVDVLSSAESGETTKAQDEQNNSVVPLVPDSKDAFRVLKAMRVTGGSFVGTHRVDCSTGLPVALELDQSLCVEMLMPGGQATSLEFSRRLRLERVEANVTEAR